MIHSYVTQKIITFSLTTLLGYRFGFIEFTGTNSQVEINVQKRHWPKFRGDLPANCDLFIVFLIYSSRVTSKKYAKSL